MGDVPIPMTSWRVLGVPWWILGDSVQGSWLSWALVGALLSKTAETWPRARLLEYVWMSVCANVCLYIALPVLLAHCGMIVVPAMAMSIIGGLLIYGTIISFTMFFHEEQDF